MAKAEKSIATNVVQTKNFETVPLLYSPIILEFPAILAITNINSTILRKTTIMPGTINGGYVTLSKIPLPEPKKGFAYFECRRKSAGVGGYDGSCDRYLNKQADTVPKPVDAVDVKVIVTIEGERHEFTFRQSNVKS